MTRLSVSRIDRAVASSTPSTDIRSRTVARWSFARPPKWFATAVAVGGGQAAHPVQQAEPLRGRFLGEIGRVLARRERVGGESQVEHLVVGELRHAGQRVGDRTSGGEVVGDDEVEFVVDFAVQLVDLHAQQAGVDAEFDDHGLDLVGDAVHHFATLHRPRRRRAG